MATRIKAAVTRATGAAPVIESLSIDDPRDGEVLVEIVAVGVCHTDMVMRDQLVPVPQPVVLGHEGSGIVRKVGPGVTTLQPGDHVVLTVDSCGHCTQCELDDPAYCHRILPLNFLACRADGSTALADADGKPVHSHVFGQSSFASHAIAHERNTVKIRKDVPLELMGPLGCGMQTGAGTVLEELKVRRGSSVAVSGTGAVGIAAIMAAKIAGAATIVALDINQERIALARELGATHGFIATSASMADHARAAGLERGFDYIIDTTGIPAVVSDAVPALAPRGQVCLVGAYPPEPKVAFDATVVMSEGRVIRGIVEGSARPQTFIPALIEHWRDGQFPFDRLVEFFDFDDIAAAIEAGETGKVVKPILKLSA